MKPLHIPRFLATLLAAYLGFSFLQRLAYAAWIYFSSHNFPERLPFTLGRGICLDLCVSLFLFAPVFLFLLLGTPRFLARRGARRTLLGLSAFPFFVILFSSVAETFFFNEFSARFNFIAVDYLIYTNEVLKNIWESYPIAWILAGIVLLTLPVFLGLRRRVQDLTFETWNVRARGAIALVVAALIGLNLVVSEEKLVGGQPYWAREVAKNGIYALFAAYFQNSIEYGNFYASIPADEATELTHRWIEEEVGAGAAAARAVGAPPRRPLAEEDVHSIVRNIRVPGTPRRLNVAVVVMESMSARFLAHYGNTQGLTPNLDRLADQSLFLSDVYATGTRTVRGLEALLVGLPPTPGQSILRRPKSDGIFNLGSVLNDQGYRSQFLYGGYGYFDNMQDWFSTNGFEVVDRAKFAKDEIGFTNAWGVSDEDLFRQTIQAADAVHATGKPFFQVILTTSNHRPYTYPSNRIDIPSHTGRDGAVKYADFAVGKFVEDARKKPWFKDTLFVFVADHNASVAGGVDIPVHDYLIPVLFYSPENVKPARLSTMGSQIDVAPTLLGLLGTSYQSRFYGQDLTRGHGGRALMGTYQKVAWMEAGKMILLSPGKVIEALKLGPDGGVLARTSYRADELSRRTDDVKLTIAIYQSASALFSSGASRLEMKFPTRVNVREY